MTGSTGWQLPAATCPLPRSIYNPHVALDEKIHELRRQKLRQIEALGQPAYPTRFDFTHAIPQILAEYGGKTGEELEANRVNVGRDWITPPM